MPSGKKPYVPDMDACRMVIHAEGATCYVMDTCCKITAADKKHIDSSMIDIYRQALLRRRTEEEYK